MPQWGNWGELIVIQATGSPSSAVAVWDRDPLHVAAGRPGGEVWLTEGDPTPITVAWTIGIARAVTEGRVVLVV